MLQNTSKTLGFQKIMVYKTPPWGGGGGGKPYLGRGLFYLPGHLSPSAIGPVLPKKRLLPVLSIDSRFEGREKVCFQ